MSAEIVAKDDTILTNRVCPPSSAILQLPNFDRATLRRSHYTFTDVAPNNLEIFSNSVLKSRNEPLWKYLHHLFPIADYCVRI